MSTPPFAFADPRPAPDNYDTFNPKDVFADSGVPVPPPEIEPIPPPTRTPLVLNIQDVLGSAATKQIQQAGQIVFHSVGDTGGVKNPAPQFSVADAMIADLAGKDYSSSRPAFFYHLGDVIYYFGQDQYYFDQFYDPYRDYAAPIFAIPGNHDGVTAPSISVPYSLQPFVENFCTEQPMHNPIAQGCVRTTMTQPAVYFELDAPFVKFIGLYSNAGETAGVISGGNAGTAQLQFLLAQLQAVAAQRKNGDTRALVLAVHHPPFTGSSKHFPSPAMLADIDAQCTKAGVWPDLVLSGHAHLYERYTRTMKSDGRQIPYVVAGNGGYLDLTPFKTGKGGSFAQPGIPGTDGKGNTLTLESYNDKSFGFLRIAVSANIVVVNSLGVDQTTKATSTLDTFTLDLKKHVVSNVTKSAAAKSAKAKPAAKSSKKKTKGK